MREADAPSTGECTHTECARPTGGSHGRTTEAPAQRFKGAERRPRWKWGKEKRGQGHYRGRDHDHMSDVSVNYW
jgi:hypothetical protein